MGGHCYCAAPSVFFIQQHTTKARRVAGVMTPKRRKEGRKNAKRPWASPRLATEPPSSISMRNQYIIHYIVIPRETPQQPPHGKWDRIWYDDDWHIYIYMCVYAHHHYCVLCCVVLFWWGHDWLIDWLIDDVVDISCCVHYIRYQCSTHRYRNEQYALLSKATTRMNDMYICIYSSRGRCAAVGVVRCAVVWMWCIMDQ